MPGTVLTLRNRLVLLVLLPTIVFGTLFLTYTATTLRKTLTRELLEKGRFMALHGAEMASAAARDGEVLLLNLMLRKYMESDRDMRYAFIVDTKEEIVAHTFTGGVPEAVAKKREAWREVAAKTVSVLVDGEVIYDIATPLEGGGLGTLHLGLSTAHISAAMDSVMAKIFWAGAALLLAGVGAAYLFSRRLTRPLAELTEAARRIGDGDFRGRVAVSSHDEIGELARTINTMAGSLEETTVSRSRYQKQKNFLETVFQAISYPFLVVDAETLKIVMTNDAAGETWKGRPCHDFSSEGDEACARGGSCLVRAVAESGRPMAMERASYDEEGRKRVHEIHGHPVFGGEGRPVQVIKYFIDITDRKEAEREREKLISELSSALSEVKRLEGLLPICAACKKIRDNSGSWQPVDVYVASHSEAEFSHGICPECSMKIYESI
jgi:PAS domain S-box-containing protein